MKKTLITFLITALLACLSVAVIPSVSVDALSDQVSVTDLSDENFAFFEGISNISASDSSVCVADNNALYFYSLSGILAKKIAYGESTSLPTRAPDKILNTDGGCYALYNNSDSFDIYFIAADALTAEKLQCDLINGDFTVVDFDVLPDNSLVLCGFLDSSDIDSNYLMKLNNQTGALERMRQINVIGVDYASNGKLKDFALFGNTAYYIFEGKKVICSQEITKNGTIYADLTEESSGNYPIFLDVSNNGIIWYDGKTLFLRSTVTGEKDKSISLAEINGLFSFEVTDVNSISASNDLIYFCASSSNSAFSLTNDDKDVYFEKGEFILCSKLSEFNQPLDADSFNDELFILNSDNSCVVIDSQSESIISIGFSERYGKASKMCIDHKGIIYLASAKQLLTLSRDGELTVTCVYNTEVKDVSAKRNGGVYVLCDDGIFDEKGLLLTDNITMEAKRISCCGKNGNVYCLSSDCVKVLDEQGGELTTVLLDGDDYVDVFCDFSGNFYLISSDGIAVFEIIEDFPNSEISFDTDEHSFVYDESFDPENYGNVQISSICSSESSGKLIAALSNMSRIMVIDIKASLPKDDIDGKSFIADEKDISNAEFAKINGYPSTLFFSKDGAFNDHIKIDTNVIILEKHDDLCFVCIDNEFGFIYGNGISDITASSVSLKTPKIIRNNAPLFSLPSLAKTNGGILDYKYLIAVLETDKDINVIAKLSDICGIDWYAVLINENTYYVPTFEVYEFVNTEHKTYDYVIINSNPDLSISLYSEANASSEKVCDIPRGTQVKVIDRLKTDNGKEWLLVEVTYDNSIYSGWCNSDFTIPSGLTDAQKLGLILAISLCVLGAITLLVRKRIIR